ncbi:HAD-like domain-containing protein, partial [Chlamydoabsidia padenii]
MVEATPSSKTPTKPTKPHQSYVDQTKIPSETLKTPMLKKQLLILDLNGTLVSRLKPTTAFYARPYHDIFFDYIFENFTVMVWSSAQFQNVSNMCRIFGEHRNKLTLVWDRSKFGLTAKEYHTKTLTIKDLERVWKELPDFGPENTLLLDDSPEKTILQPYNHCVVSEFDHKSPVFQSNGDRELMVVKSYLEKVQYQDNVCNYIKNHPFVSSPTDEDEDSPLPAPSTICYYYVVASNGKPVSKDLGVDDELTSRVGQLRL